MIKDITGAKFIKDEPRGANKKFWIEQEYKNRLRTALYKPTYVRKDGTNTQTHFGECIYSDICKKILNLICADIEMVTYNGDIGCLSYNILEDLEDNNEECTVYNLVDMVSIIQRVRTDFDTSSLKIKGTEEYYSLDLIFEAIKDYIPDEESLKNFRKYILEVCLTDSITNYFDRHAMNLAALERRSDGEIKPPELFDNGTCFSLGIREEELKEILNHENAGKVLRALATSRIGFKEKAPITFEELETKIFNHYFDECTEFVQRIKTNLTQERVREILQDEKYDTLLPEYKQAILLQVEYNKSQMLERFEKSKKRNEVEKALSGDLEKESVNESLRKIFEGFEIHLDDVELQTIRNINSMPEKFGEKINVSEADKNIAKWTILLLNIMKNMPEELPDEAKRLILENFLKEKLNFCTKDITKIEHLLRTNNAEIEYTDSINVRTFLIGNNDVQGIGIENASPYILIKLSKAQALSIDEKRYDEFIKSYEDILEKEEYIEANFPARGKEIKTLKKMGITRTDEITATLYRTIDEIKKSGKRFSSSEEFYEYIKNIAREVFTYKEEIDGILVDKEIKEKIESSMYDIGNGETATIITEPIKNAEQIAYAMDTTFFVAISEQENGQSFMVTAKSGTLIPESIINFAKKCEAEYIERKNGNIEKNDRTIVIKQTKKESGKGKSRQKDYRGIVAIACNNNSSYGISKSIEELKRMSLEAFKERNLEK